MSNKIAVIKLNKETVSWYDPINGIYLSEFKDKKADIYDDMDFEPIRNGIKYNYIKVTEGEIPDEECNIEHDLTSFYNKKEIDEKVNNFNEQFNTIGSKIKAPLKFGHIELPSDFVEIPIKFYRDHDYVIKHNMDFNKYKTGTKLYVMENGNDNYDGSLKNPFLTLTKALNIAIAGENENYVIYTNRTMFNRDECTLASTVTNKNISIISIAKDRINEIENKQSISTTNLTGNWNTSAYSYMYYATTVGDTLTSSFTGKSLYLKFHCDYRSGIFEIKAEGLNTYTKTIDTYNTVSSPRIIEIFNDIEDDVYKLTLTYKGKSPNATESRGYVYITDFITSYNYSDTKKSKTIISTNSNYTWILENGVYKTARSGVMNVIDSANKDMYGLPVPLLKCKTLEECISTKNSYYTDNINVWINRIDGEKPTQKNTIVNIVVASLKPDMVNSTLYFENICFTGYTNGFSANATSPNDLNTEICFNDCTFIGSKSYSNKGNGLSLNNIARTFVFNCISAYSQLDGFNYHYEQVSTENSRKCFVVEYNCKGYDLGLEEVGNYSNQTSTAHEGCSILRIGTIAGNSTNSCIKDVNGCYSVLYDCNASNDIDQSEGYVFSSDLQNSAKAILINCSSSLCDTSLKTEGTNTQIFINNFKFDGVLSGNITEF